MPRILFDFGKRKKKFIALHNGPLPTILIESSANEAFAASQENLVLYSEKQGVSG